MARLSQRGVALEFFQVVARLGCRVGMMQRSGQVRLGTDGNVAEELESFRREDGVDILTATHLRAVQSLEKGKAVGLGEASRQCGSAR